MSKNICTCKDYDCPMNPVNHDKGCTPCIAKNLKENEIPSCFFHKLSKDLGNISDFSINGFVAFANRQKQRPN